jgi:hypothetical protein
MLAGLLQKVVEPGALVDFKGFLKEVDFKRVCEINRCVLAIL